MAAPTFDEIAKAKYILLTTFTKDGKPKPTAIWAVPDADRLLMMTEEDSWKVKRIRNTPRVTLAICDPRGKPKSEPVERGRQGPRQVRSALGDPRSQQEIRGFRVVASAAYMKVRGLDKKSVGLELKAA